MALGGGEPGSRFRDEYHAHRAGRRSPWRRGLRIAVGLGVIAGGVVALPAPGPGTLIILLGAAILARESRTMAGALDWLEVRLRRGARRLARTWRRAGTAARALLVLAGVALTAGLAVLAVLTLRRI